MDRSPDSPHLGLFQEAENLKEWLEVHAIETVRVIWCDLFGLARGKRYSKETFLKNHQQGFSFSQAALHMNLRGQTVTDSPEDVWPNIYARPDFSTLHLLPYEPHTAQVIADLYTAEGKPLEESPRGVLSRVAQKLTLLGWDILLGLELEFYVFDEQSQPITQSSQVYRLLSPPKETSFLETLQENLRKMGLGVDSLSAEDSPSQFEVTLLERGLLKAGDSAFIAKNAIKEIAHRQGLQATFLSKPLPGQSGNGFHFHQTLLDKEGQPLFHLLPCHPLPPQFASFLAGQLEDLPYLSAIYLPTINAYKRVLLRGVGPLVGAWGWDNRTVALRVLTDAQGVLRLENRVAGGEANPYLVIAGALAGGLRGVAEALTPPPPCSESAYFAKEAIPLPSNLAQALENLQKRPYIAEYLGPNTLKRYLQLKQDEVYRYERFISDWEKEEYLPFL